MWLMYVIIFCLKVYFKVINVLFILCLLYKFGWYMSIICIYYFDFIMCVVKNELKSNYDNNFLNEIRYWWEIMFYL